MSSYAYPYATLNRPRRLAGMLYGAPAPPPGPGSVNSPYYYGGGGRAPTPPGTNPQPTVPYVHSPGIGTQPSPSVVTNPVAAPVTPEPPPMAPPPGAVAGGRGAPPSIDTAALYSNAIQSDPVYQQALQAAAAQRKTTASGFLERLKMELLGYGSQEYAKSVLNPLQGQLGGYIGGDLGLKKFYKAISENPETSFSTLGQLNRLTPQALLNTKENVNKANLFYSGHGAKAISDQTYLNQKAYADANKAIQGQIMNDRQSYLGTLAGIDANLASAAEGAYMRALQQAYTYALYYPPGGGAGSDGLDWNAPVSSASGSN